jgi:integrase
MSMTRDTMDGCPEAWSRRNLVLGRRAAAHERHAGAGHGPTAVWIRASLTFLTASQTRDVMDLLGHSSIVLTSNTYGHVLEERQRAAASGMDAVLSG